MSALMKCGHASAASVSARKSSASVRSSCLCISLTPLAPEPRPKGRPRKVRRVIGKRVKRADPEQEPPGLTHSVPMQLPSFTASRVLMTPPNEPSCTLHEEDQCDRRAALSCNCDDIFAELNLIFEDAIVVPHLAHSV